MLKNPMGIFRTVISTFVLVIFVYVSHQLTRFTNFSWQSTTLLVSFLAFLFALVIGSFMLLLRERRLDHNPWRDRFMNGALTVMAYINFLISLIILRDVFAFLDKISIATLSLETLYSSQATTTLMGLPVLFILVGHLIVRKGAFNKTVPLRFTHLPADLENLRIVHITDLHISPSLPVRLVKKLVSQVNKLKPDLIVFTGDILDSFVEKHTEEFQILKGLHAKHGIYYVPGNHEYYWNATKSLQAFRDIGFQVLINKAESLRLGSAELQMIGIPDPAANHFKEEGPDLVKVQSQLKPDSFKVLLSHQPALAKHIEKLGVDLQLSGHTHGGQFFPWNLLIVFFQRYNKGLYRIGDMQLYVNQGTGYWGPQLRLGTYCELTEIILRKE